MPKPKEPTKFNANKNPAIVGSVPVAKLKRAPKGANRTSKPDDAAPDTPGKAKTASRSKSKGARASAKDITRPNDAKAQAAGAEQESGTEVEGGSDGSGSGASAHSVPLDAVLDAGECFNTIRFHLNQDQLFWDDEHRDEARRVLGRLGRLVRRIVPARERARLRAKVVDPVERLIDRLGSGQRYENLIDTNHNLRDRFPDVDLSRYRREFVEPVDEAIHDSRAIVESVLNGDDLALLVLQLGEILDQGVHPVDPDNFYIPRERPTAQAKVRRLNPGAVRDAPQNIEEDLLANGSFWGGELPPAESWAAEVRQLLDELPVLDSVPDGLLNPQAGKSRDSGEVVALLRDSIRTRLCAVSGAHDGASGPVARRPNASRRGRNEKRDEWLYEQHLDQGRSWVSILKELNSKSGWYRLGSIQAVIAAVSRYANWKKNLGPLPRDHGKRSGLPEALS